jgi:preprotein translocase subunit YajC
MQVKQLNVSLAVGQTIQLASGHYAEITKIEFFPSSGEIRLNTTQGPRSALTFKLVESDTQSGPADKYR